MQTLNEENEERQARFQARFQNLSEKPGNCRRETSIVEEEEVQALQAAEERSGSCASQSNGCCSDPAMVEQTDPYDGSIEKSFSASRFGACGRRRREQEWEGDRDKGKAASDRYDGDTVDLAVDLAWCQKAGKRWKPWKESRHTKK